jgi:hypothetical protein
LSRPSLKSLDPPRRPLTLDNRLGAGVGCRVSGGGWRVAARCRAGAADLEFGSRVAMQNSHATNDDELHPLRDVPRWTWEGDDTEA